MPNYAMIADGETRVFNTIIADPTFTYEGYYFILIETGVFCETGDYYNSADGKFYIDAEFTEVAGLSR